MRGWSPGPSNPSSSQDPSSRAGVLGVVLLDGSCKSCVVTSATQDSQEAQRTGPVPTSKSLFLLPVHEKTHKDPYTVHTHTYTYTHPPYIHTHAHTRKEYVIHRHTTSYVRSRPQTHICDRKIHTLGYTDAHTKT